MSELVYDSGALVAAEHGDRRFWLVHRRALERGVLPIIPSAVIAEIALPGMRNLDRLLAGCVVESLDLDRARRAAHLRHQTADATVVDAVVVESALRHGAAVVTSDRGDVQSLANSANRAIAVIDV